MKFNRKIFPDTKPSKNFITKKRLKEDEIDFNKLRDWCWDTYGPSCDMKDYDFIHEVSLAQHNDNGGNLNEHWCWSNEDYNPTDSKTHKKRRIYLAEDAERTWLEMRWR